MARSFSRPKARQVLRPRVVIACEGKKTEHGYFSDLYRIERLTSVEVLILDHKGTDPRTVVGRVADFMKSERRQEAWAKDDLAWAVFDGDEHQQEPKGRENWHSAINQALDLGIGLAISNPSFEFWYLLHYQDHYSNLTRQKANQLLKQHVPRYEKSDRLYPVLRPMTEQAIARAETLRRQAERNGLDQHDNPCCSGVAQLVDTLLKMK